MTLTIIELKTIGAARKAHHCDLCGRQIEAGEQYRRQRALWDGEPFVWRGCRHCSAFARLANLYDLSWEDGLTADDVCEFEPSTITEARWKVQWKRKWRRRDGSLYPVPTDTAAAENVEPEEGEHG